MFDTTERTTRIQTVASGLLVVCLLVALALVYWALPRASALAERADNPRLVQAELQIWRGRILDSNGVVLAETVGPSDQPQRRYPIPNVGPAVGYYSFRHGTSGIEGGYSAVLRGDAVDTWEAFWRSNLHGTQMGHDIRLTLNADWQRQAEALMAEQHGAVLLLTIPDGEVKVMVSHPGYDPNTLDEQFEDLVADESGPLLNRTMQGLYQPGLVLQPFLLAASVDRGLIRLSEPVAGAGRLVPMNGQQEGCREEPPQDATWVNVLQNGCPAPMQTLDSLGAGGLATIYRRFGFVSRPQLPLEAATPLNEPVVDVSAALLGQDLLTVTPMQIGLAWTALANGGIAPAPTLVAAVQDGNGVWQMTESDVEGSERVVSAEAAGNVLAALPRHEGRAMEYATLALSGPEGITNGWYLGLAPAGAPRYAAIVVVEGADRLSAAQQVGRSLLDTATSAE
jgi:peptidoglycan glycosyltransferase